MLKVDIVVACSIVCGEERQVRKEGGAGQPQGLAGCGGSGRNLRIGRTGVLAIGTGLCGKVNHVEARQVSEVGRESRGDLGRRRAEACCSKEASCSASERRMFLLG